MTAGLLAGLTGAVLFGLGAVILAHAVRRHVWSAERLPDFVRQGVRDPWTMLVVAMYVTGWALHVVAIWLLPLYLAQATVAMSLAVTALASRVLREHLGPRDWVSLAAVTGGTVLLAAGSGAAGPTHTSSTFAAWLGIAFVAYCLAAVIGVSSRGTALGGSVLGALAGLGYAASAIAVRGLGWPPEGVMAVAALVVPAVSVVAFWLYFLGMDRAGAAAVAGPLIVAQTFVPAVVGVVLLGDGVRADWWPLLAVGLVAATAGAVSLARGQLRRPGGVATWSWPDPAR